MGILGKNWARDRDTNKLISRNKKRNALRRLREFHHDAVHDLWEIRQESKRRRGKLTPPPDPKEVIAETYGSPLPLNFGAYRHETGVIWARPITPHFPDPNNENVGGGTDDPNKALWSCSFAVKIAEGEQGELLRVWLNGQLAYQQGNQAAATYPNIAGNLAFYNGSETQEADPTITEDKGTLTPAYRGVCYLVFKDLPLARYGDALPTVEVELTSAALPDYTTYTTAITTPAVDDTENFIVSRNTDFLYVLSGGLFSIVQRSNNTLIAEFDLDGIVNNETGGNIQPIGRLCVEEGASGAFGVVEPVYLFCYSGGLSFIFKFGNDFVNNFATAITGEETSGYVLGNHLFTADGTNGKIHCYNKTTLTRLWTRNGPVTGAVAGNFTHDNNGRVWLVWYDGGDPDSLHLSRIGAGGVVHNTTIAETDAAAQGIAYDSLNEKLVTGGGNTNKLCFLTPTQTPTLDGSAAGVSGLRTRPLFVAQSRFKKTFWVIESDIAKRYATATRILRATVDLSDYYAQTNSEGWGYSSTDRAFYAIDDAAPTYRKLPINRYTNDAPPIGGVIGDLVERCGYTSSNYDVTDLASADPLEGYAVPDRTTAAPALQMILDAYQIATREHYASTYSEHLKLEFVRRSTSAASIVAVIPNTDLGMGEGVPEDNPIGEDHTDDEDLPRIVTVRYADRLRDYSTQAQQATLPQSILAGLTEFGIDASNVVLTSTQALRLAENTQRAMWVEGEIKQFNIGLKYLYLEPEDHITLTTPDGWQHTIRLETVELGANLIIACSGVVTDPGVWTNASTGVDGDDQPGVIDTIQPARPFLLDLPACRDVDGLPQDGGFYGGVAPLGDGSNWQGAALVRSVAGGLSFETCGGFSAGVNYGTTTVAFADATDCTTYHASDSLTCVKGYGEDWADATEAELYQDRTHNLVAVGSISRGYELIQFTNYTDNGDGTITLAGMLRGQFGTEALSVDHVGGEDVILIDLITPTIKRVVLPVSDRGTTHIYKAVSAGLPLSSAPGVSFTHDCASLKPYAASHVVAELNTPATDDITLNWYRRSRIGADLIDEFDIAVNEEQNHFEVDIREASADDPIVRTFSVNMEERFIPPGVALSIDGPTQTLHSVGYNFITFGWVKGQVIDIGGDGLNEFVNAANNGRFTITAITATDLTLEGITTLVTEAAPATTPDVWAVTPAIRYTAAQQTTDFGSPKGNVYFSIYQISKTLEDGSGDGRGFPYAALLP